jgi:hypothetical protein
MRLFSERAMENLQKSSSGAFFINMKKIEACRQYYFNTPGDWRTVFKKYGDTTFNTSEGVAMYKTSWDHDDDLKFTAAQ